MARNRRRRRPDPPGPIGFLVVDKPVGWTSHDVVDAARRWLGIRKVGHLGTLDPLATGVLPLAIRGATKLVPFLADGQKTYVGTIRLGVSTDTFDAEGRVTHEHDGPLPEEPVVKQAVQAFRGEIQQLPPMYSSVKKDGVPLYRLARKGEEVERELRSVTIHQISMPHYEPPEIGIEVHCTPGTYVRTLAADLGEKLGCGAHLSGLRRTRSGPFTLEQARTPEAWEALAEAGELEAELTPPDQALELPRVRLTAVQARKVGHGAAIPAAEASGEFEMGPPPRPGDRLSALIPSGEMLAVMELRPDRWLHPLRLLDGS
ncbi:MAG: tRNA pseudouridine(55) synthase TruB [bacterium]|nr:tRNA pseudouridine(55) synthase TruB [bacterium]MCP5070094.1 tRNA pseudouridine(55) synthase TruB [bacterium]